MLFKYATPFVLAFLVLNACAGTTGYRSEPPLKGAAIYDAERNPALEEHGDIIYEDGPGNIEENSDSSFGKEDLFTSEMPYGLFFHKYDSEVWKSYYYFLHLRKGIENFPQVVPESEYDIPVVLNYRVHRFLDYFQGPGRSFFSKWLSRSGIYIPMMKKILEEWEMPTDLVYMAMIESGFNVKARSHKGAVGPWQFIQSTGKRYRLRIDSWVDERMDPEKSTVAAANYLRDLYDMFESWELAAAGYNCGEDRVQAAIETFKVSDFWEISEYTLPRETRDYVPKLMAALIIAKNPEKYGFTGIEYYEPEPYEKVHVPSQRSLRDMAKVIGLNEERLIELNPSLITGSTPPGGSYEISVPFGYGKVVTTKYNDITALKVVTAKVRTTTHTAYRVKRGDSLGRIASRYGVSVSSLRRANGIRGSLIKIGQVLSIPGGYGSSYVRGSGTSFKYKVRRGDTLGGIAARYGVAVSSIKRANRINGSKIIAGQVITISGSTASKGSDGDIISYRIRRGDTLWDIANKYDVSISDIKKWNNLNTSRLLPGKGLRIYLR